MKSQILKFIFTFLLSILVISCASSEKKGNEKVDSLMSHPKSLDYGTAQVACTITDIKEVEGFKTCIVKIDTVFGYGAGVRPIGTGTEIELTIEKSLNTKSLKIGSKQNLTLKYMKEKFGGAVKYPWQIIKLKNK